MDDPPWVWPAWKFDMKRDDLFGSLNDLYNTFPSTIQDPEAFHHDVYEISNEASTTEEFHRLMACRKRQRLLELHESLEAAAVEIIANPKLIGTDKWGLALQLFRSRSLDSLIRYFSSYLPKDFQSFHSTSSSFSDCHSVRTTSTKATSVDDSYPSFFGDDAELTHEPLVLKTELHAVLDDNCPSLFDGHSDTSVSSPTHIDALSYSESEMGDPDALVTRFHVRDDASHLGDETSVTSELDLASSRDCLPSIEKDDEAAVPEMNQSQLSSRKQHDEMPFDMIYDDDDDDACCAQFPADDFYPSGDAEETPTPRQEPFAAVLHSSIKILRRRARSPPKPPTRGGGRRADSPLRTTRRSPEESMYRVMKPQLEVSRLNRPALRRER